MKKMIIQLPDGLKPRFEEFVKKYEDEYLVFVWGGSNYGSCDIPLLPKELDDVIILNVGHNSFPPKVD